MLQLALDADVGALGDAPAWSDPTRAIYDALVGIIRFERKHGYPRGTLVAAMCEPAYLGDPVTILDGAGKPPLML